jgi:hypothetical protein
MFTLCAANGRIIDLYGPFYAINNDASIISAIIEQESELRSLLIPNDVLILDRGFRDCVDNLKKKYQLLVQMPTCKYIIINIFELLLIYFELILLRR